MAFTPYFVASPSLVLSLVGLLRGPEQTTPTPSEDWRTARVDVVIPAFNEAENIALCLASVMRQTFTPRRIILIDDGSTDGTVDIARAFCDLHGVELTAVHRRAPIGKTPTLKRQACELDSDVEFILDGDTVLESADYIERTVQELYQAVGIASACGTILPQRASDRRRWLDRPELRAFRTVLPGAPLSSTHRLRESARAVTTLYRECLYLFLQKLIYRGQNVLLGTITNPIGCAVAYRRTYVRELFDHFGPLFGDDLTNSEDIFIGLALLDMGYRNIQVPGVTARTVEPPVYRLPRQVYLWSSAYLQSCYYFDSLLRSPFKAVGRWLRSFRRPPGGGALTGRSARANGGEVVRLTPSLPGASAGSMLAPAPLLRVATASPFDSVAPASGGPTGRERRRIAEPYRQPFGRDWTKTIGRPAGWILLTGAIEKIFFPTTLVILIVLGAWSWLLLTLAIDTAVSVTVLALAMKGQRLEYLTKALAAAPVRYAILAAEAVTMAFFAWQVWVTKNRRWRK